MIATLTTMDAVTDESMDFPKTFPLHPEYKATEAASAAFNSAEADAPAVPSISGLPSVDQAASAPGHHPLGRTVAIHSVCVLPPYQHLGLGKILLRSYLQRMEGSGIADRAALLAHDELTEWYVSSLGFAQKGRSAATHGGGNLNDLVCLLSPAQPLRGSAVLLTIYSDMSSRTRACGRDQWATTALIGEISEYHVQ